MTIEELIEQWREDSKIDLSQLDVESAKIPILHHKYYSIYIPEKIKLKKLTTNLKKLRLVKYEYYSGTLSDEECVHYGWEQFDRKLMKTDVDRYIDADKDVIELTLKITLQEEKTEFLNSILKSFNARGFNLRVAMDFLRFQNGS
jgi:hypothetical protein